MDLDKDFWIDTYNRNIKKLIGVCYRYVFDLKIAEDLAHDSFLIAMKKKDSFKSKGYFDAWLRKITVNTALQYLRKVKKIEGNQQELLCRELINKDEEMFHNYNFTTQELLNAINRLPEHHRNVFNLYVIDGFTHKQISEELNISVGTSKSHLARARKKLQEILNLKQERKRYFILLLLPFRFGQIERLYKKEFKNYEILPKQASFLKAIDWTKVKKPYFTLHLIIVKGIVAIVIISSILGIIIKTNYKPTEFNSNTTNQKNIDTISVKTDTSFIIKNNESIKQRQEVQTSKPVVVKKKRIIHKKVIVRDTLTIIDTSNVK